MIRETARHSVLFHLHGTAMPVDDTRGSEKGRRSWRASLTGLFGSGFALLCCAGVTPVVGFLSAIGLGFLMTDRVLIPFLVLALGVTGWGLWSGRRCHGRPSPLFLGLGGGALALAGLYLWVPLAWMGFGGVILASVWNLRLLRACAIASPGAP